MLAVVAGLIASFPVGGVAWDYAQYALGLERLGFDVYYLEDSEMYSYDPLEREYLPQSDYGLGFLERTLRELSPSLADRWHLRDLAGERHGMPLESVKDVLEEAAVLINVSGGCILRDEYRGCRRKVLIDTDPGWNHFFVWPRLDQQHRDGKLPNFRDHDYFFTYAERIGTEDCALPDQGIEWLPTRPPVVLERWDADGAGDRWTTVLTWDNYARPIEVNGHSYGSKAMEFARIDDVPHEVDAAFELAIGGIGAPVTEWLQKGWALVDSTTVSLTPESYRSYIQRSRGEFSVAKNVYVDTRSGWFSCRSACYLAAGRPAVLQDTGWSDSIPAGEGLLAFSTREEAIADISKVEADYEGHSEAARSVAKDYLSSERVLGDMLERIGV